MCNSMDMATPPVTAYLAPPKDLSHHFSRVTKNREASSIKAFYKYFQIPGIGNLAGGLPHASYFPYDTLEASAALPNRFKPTPNDPVEPPPTNGSPPKPSDPSETRVFVPHDSQEPNLLRKIDLATALQYGQAQGFPPLATFVHEFALTKLHPNIPYSNGAETILTCGNTDGFSKFLECFNNPWDAERDWIREREGILCEEFAYMNAIQTAAPRGLNIVPVVVDAEGMVAYGRGGLLDVLEHWDKTKGKRPHLMYTVTMGQNPTSGLLSVRRRKEIYAIAQRFDIVICEDDPYFFLQFPSAANAFSATHRGSLVSMNHYSESNLNHQTSLRPGAKSSGSAFLDSLVPSFLSLDTDGRVFRLDTFSKTVAPGCRLGWITAQPAVIERIQRITEASTQQPSGFVQSLVAELLIGPDEHDGRQKHRRRGELEATGWKMDGWIRWLEGLRGNYERRMQAMCTALEEGKYTTKELPAHTDSPTFTNLTKTQIYDFVPPMAGMFLWVHVDFTTHPLYDNSLSARFRPERLALANWVFQTRKPHLILSAPGTIFSPTAEIKEKKGWQYFRLCFAAVDEAEVKSDSERFARAMQDFWDIEDPKVIQELLDEADAEDVAERHFRTHAERGLGKWAGVNPALF